MEIKTTYLKILIKVLNQLKVFSFTPKVTQLTLRIFPNFNLNEI